MLLLMNLLTFKSLLLILSTYHVSSQTLVSVWEHWDYTGSKVDLDDLDQLDYIYFTVFKNQMSSFKIKTGSCVQFHTVTPPTHKDGTWFLATEDTPRVPENYNDKIKSVTKCGKFNRRLECPKGEFIKSIKWDNTKKLTEGFELDCYIPQSKTAANTYRSHGSEELNKKEECVGIRGMKYTRDSTKLANTDLSPVCKELVDSKPGPYDYICDNKNEALTGVRLELEWWSDYIKSGGIICEAVEKIEDICKAHDKLNLLFTCDASQAQHSLFCSHKTTVGMGQAVVQTETQSTESSFYYEFGFELKLGALGLGQNFKTNLGKSDITGYSWTETQESTFYLETTVGVDAEAPAGCVTKVYEILGECSFMNVRPYYFQRIDDCKGAKFYSGIVVPENIAEDEAFRSGGDGDEGIPKVVSDVPESVRAYSEGMKKMGLDD